MLLQGVDSEDEELENISENFTSSWNKYWEEHGPALVWQSWIETYKDFIFPDYLNKIESEEKSEERAVEVEDTNQGNFDADWTKVWEQHQQDQKSYYFNWFSSWWSGNNQDIVNTVPLESLSLDDQSNMENLLDKDPNFSEQQEEITSGKAEESDNELPKEQRNKTNLEKTKEYITELGFATTINEPSSAITDCSKLTINSKKRKRQKKKKVNLGKVPAQPSKLNKVFEINYIFSHFSNYTIWANRSNTSLQLWVLISLMVQKGKKKHQLAALILRRAKLAMLRKCMTVKFWKSIGLNDTDCFPDLTVESS